MAETTVVIEDETIDLYRIREPGKRRIQRSQTMVAFIFDCRNENCVEIFILSEHELARSNRKVFCTESRKAHNNQLAKEISALGHAAK